jgi:hypothetical protein
MAKLPTIPPTGGPLPPGSPDLSNAVFVDLGTVDGFALPLFPVAGTAVPGNGTLVLQVALFPPPDDIDAHLVRELPGVENQFDPLENAMLLFAIVPGADGLPARDLEGRERVEILSVAYSAPVDGQPGRFELSAIRARLGSITLAASDFNIAELWLAPRKRLVSLTHNTLAAHAAPGLSAGEASSYPFRAAVGIDYAQYTPPTDEPWPNPVNGPLQSRLLPWALGDSGISIELVGFQAVSGTIIWPLTIKVRLVARDGNLQRYTGKIVRYATGEETLFMDVGPLPPGDTRSGLVEQKSMSSIVGSQTGAGTHCLIIQAETTTGRMARFTWDIDWSNVIVNS